MTQIRIDQIAGLPGIVTPNNSNLVFLGDSITEFGLITTSPTTSYSSRGYSAWVQLLTGNKLNPINLGTGGNLTADLVARIYPALAYAPKIIVIEGGANDIIGSSTFDTIIANLTLLKNAFLAIGSKVFMPTILPQFSTYTPTAPREAVRVAVNAWITAQTDIISIDLDTLMNNSTYYIDGLHPNTIGAQIMGNQIALKMVGFLSSYRYSDIILPNIGFTNNPLVTGTGGGLTIATGTVADSWNLDTTNSGGVTVVASKDASDKQVLTVSGTYTGNSKVIEFYQSYTTTPPSAASILEGILDYDVTSALTNISSIHFQIQVYTTGFGSLLVNQFGLTPYDSLYSLPVGNYIDKTALLAITAGAPAIVVNRVRIILKDTASPVAASGVIKINKLGVRKWAPTGYIAANSITYDKIQSVTTNKLLGSGSGTAVAEITLGTGLSFTGTTLNAAITSAPIIQASADLTAQTTAGNVTTFTVGAATATFDVSNYINVTAVTTDVIQGQITYTDENNTAQTISLASLSAVGNSQYSPLTIRAKNGTVITVKTNLTTGIGTITFDTGARIIQH